MKNVVWNQIIYFTAIILLIACKKEESVGDFDDKIPHWPEVKRLEIANATDTIVKVSGSINVYGLPTTVIFEYGTTTKYGSTVTASQSPVTGDGIKIVSADISGLMPDSTYHFRLKADNYWWINFYGKDIEFTVQTLKVFDLNVSNITSTSATLNVTVYAAGLPTTVTFEYGTTTRYGNSIPAMPNSITGNSLTNVSADISGLNPCETYYFKAKAVNSFRTIYSPDTVFFLANEPPVLTTASITGITATTAVSGGSVANVGCIDIIDRGIMWGKRICGKVGCRTTYSNRTHDGEGPGIFTSKLTGLNPSTTYSLRSYAITNYGTIYGNVISFKTTP